MGTQPTNDGRYRFGAFELDLRTGELRKNGTVTNLPPQPCKILALLVSHAGELVTREEIQEQIWGNDTFVDFENGLNFAIKRIRTVLGDDADSPRYIETLPRRGYRFIAPLEKVNGTPPALNAAIPTGFVPEPGVDAGNAETLPITISPPTLAMPRVDAAVAARPATEREIAAPAQIQWSGRRLVLTMGIATAFLAVAAFILVPRLLRVGSYVQAPSAATQVRLVVLPFKNLSGDANQDYFSDGMTEELSTQLGNLNPSRLTVVGRTSAMTYKKSQRTVREIGKELNVDYAIEGSIRKSGNTVRITAQLLRTADDSHIWAQDYDRDSHDLLALETEIAQDVASQVHVTLVMAGQQTRPDHVPDAKAFDEYLRGRYLWNQRDSISVKESIAHFEQAVRQDPSWAAANAGLADALFLDQGMDLKARDHEKAVRALEKALQLDPNLAEAHATLGALEFYGNWDWAAAEQEYRRAIQLDPNYPTAHHWYSEYLADRGKFEDALSEAREAQRLDPLSPIINISVGWDYYSMHQPDRAIQEVRRALEITPNSRLAYEALGLAQEQKGQFSEGIAAFQKSVDIAGNTPNESEYSLVHAYAVSGRRRESIQMLTHLIARDRERSGLAFGIAIAYVGLGDRERAFEWLDRSYKAHDWIMFELRTNPRFDPIRSDPRFQELLRRVGLPG